MKALVLLLALTAPAMATERWWCISTQGAAVGCYEDAALCFVDAQNHSKSRPNGSVGCMVYTSVWCYTHLEGTACLSSRQVCEDFKEWAKKGERGQTACMEVKAKPKATR